MELFQKVEQAERILAEIGEDQVVLYHSGVASEDAALCQGIEPRFGSWLEEVLCGATDDDETAQEVRGRDAISFYSETPRWVVMKASRAAGKAVCEMTEADVLAHGQLCIVVVDRDERGIYRAGDDGRDGPAKQFCGTDDRDYIHAQEIPFGVEPGDIFTFDAFIPTVTLTGEDLLQFLERNEPEQLRRLLDEQEERGFGR